MSKADHLWASSDTSAKNDDSLDKWFEKIDLKADQIKYTDSLKKAASDSISAFTMSLLASFALEQMAKENNEKKKYQTINKTLIEKMVHRIEFRKDGFVLLDKDLNVVKSINSPGQLGLAIFQILNDIIEQYDIDQKNQELLEKEKSEEQKRKENEAYKQKSYKAFKNSLYGEFTQTVQQPPSNNVSWDDIFDDL